MKEAEIIKKELGLAANAAYRTQLLLHQVISDLDSMEKKLKRSETDQDIQFLAKRADEAGKTRFSGYRETGASSNSIVAIAYGILPLADQILPSDDSDLTACENMWKKLPEHRKTPEVLSAMERARCYIDEK